MDNRHLESSSTNIYCPEMDEEAKSPDHLATQTNEGGLGEAGALPGYAGGHGVEEEPGSGAPGPHDISIDLV